ncbi:NAD(P)H-binding protein [Rothia sp. ARF10]|nr:NAD(P)H-binding protein [Rothia sp. ARF10]
MSTFDNPTILVLGSTGLMGREVVRSLNERGVTPRVLVRNPSRLRPTDKVEVHRGDLRDPATLDAAMADVDVVFHISPHEPDEVALAKTVIAATERAGARLVFAGIHIDASNRLANWAMRTLYGRLLPRYRGKIAIGHLVETSDTNPIMLGVGNFMQCDEVLLDVIRDGKFVLPTHRKGLNRVDLHDLGEIAADVLLDPTTPAGAYPVCGPRSLTGAECAAIWSDALGTHVVYVGDDDAAIDDALTAHLTGYRLEDWKSSFRALRGFAVKTKQSELDATTRLLGRPPTDFTEFVRRIVDEHGLAPSTATGADGIPAASQTEGALR